MISEEIRNNPELLEKARAKQREYNARWAARHPEANKKKMDGWSKWPHKWDSERGKIIYRRRRQNPSFVIMQRVGGRIRSAVVNGHKSASSANLLGCTIAELKAHLQSLFLPGMTWENIALWHIDHIRPCSSFNLLDPEQQRCCFHYTNLQPLWAADNIRKSNKIVV